MDTYMLMHASTHVYTCTHAACLGGHLGSEALPPGQMSAAPACAPNPQMGVCHGKWGRPWEERFRPLGKGGHHQDISLSSIKVTKAERPLTPKSPEVPSGPNTPWSWIGNLTLNHPSSLRMGLSTADLLKP